MADLSGITAVRPTSNTVTELVVYGGTIAVGEPVYLDTADTEYKQGDASASATAAVVGIAMTPGVDGGYGLIAKSGNIILVGTTMAVGQQYVVSATAGKIAPSTDLASGEYVTELGHASSATQLNLNITATSIAHA